MKPVITLVGILALVVAVVAALATGRRPQVVPVRSAGAGWRSDPNWAGAQPVPLQRVTSRGVPVVEAPARVVPTPQRARPLPANDNAAAAQPGTADMFAAWGPPPAPALDARRFSEAHWQGLELIPKTARVAKVLGLPPDIRGVIVDDVSLPADLQGFRAGDVVMYVEQFPTPNLTAFVEATDQLRDLPSASVQIFRAGATRRLKLTGLLGRLGTANGETPTMIRSGARSPHGYLGPCTSCHRVGTTGSLATDQGDPATKTAPVIRAGSIAPHRDRGTCTACHRILP